MKNTELHNVYNKIKYIISGCRTFDDALLMCQPFDFNKQEKDLIHSVINVKQYNNIIDIRTFLKLMDEINELKYKDDAYETINQIMKRTTDTIQLKTLMRIANTKQIKPYFISLKEKAHENNINTITKKCPHAGCKHEHIGNKNTDYVICGYTINDGYDWKGCGRDWCFKCEKILCKSWDSDQLFLQFNRIHDQKCCKKHAHNNNNNYPNEYCHCDADYIQRTKTL
jgi:hypothetical protein